MLSALGSQAALFLCVDQNIFWVCGCWINSSEWRAHRGRGSQCDFIFVFSRRGCLWAVCVLCVSVVPHRALINSTKWPLTRLMSRDQANFLLFRLFVFPHFSPYTWSVPSKWPVVYIFLSQAPIWNVFGFIFGFGSHTSQAIYCICSLIRAKGTLVWHDLTNYLCSLLLHSMHYLHNQLESTCFFYWRLRFKQTPKSPDSRKCGRKTANIIYCRTGSSSHFEEQRRQMVLLLYICYVSVHSNYILGGFDYICQ